MCTHPDKIMAIAGGEKYAMRRGEILFTRVTQARDVLVHSFARSKRKTSPNSDPDPDYDAMQTLIPILPLPKPAKSKSNPSVTNFNPDPILIPELSGKSSLATQQISRSKFYYFSAIYSRLQSLQSEKLLCSLPSS